MEPRSHHLPGELSGGEQQRVAIATALVIKPLLLLADEPTGNLDTENSRRITSLLTQLVSQEGQAVVIVTHDPEVAAQANRIVRLRDGVIEQIDQMVDSGAVIATKSHSGVQEATR